MNPLKSEITEAVWRSVADSGAFGGIEVHDIEFQTEGFIRVKEKENCPARLFQVLVKEIR